MTVFRPLLCAALIAVASLPAQATLGHADAAALVQREIVLASLSRDDAAALVQRETGGRVLAVDRFDAGGRAVWRVKVVTPRGDVRVVLVDVATGQTQ